MKYVPAATLTALSPRHTFIFHTTKFLTNYLPPSFYFSPEAVCHPALCSILFLRHLRLDLNYMNSSRRAESMMLSGHTTLIASSKPSIICIVLSHNSKLNNLFFDFYDLQLKPLKLTVDNLLNYTNKNGGGERIRTSDTISRILAFQASTLSHSVTPPALDSSSLA